MQFLAFLQQFLLAWALQFYHKKTEVKFLHETNWNWTVNIRYSRKEGGVNLHLSNILCSGRHSGFKLKVIPLSEIGKTIRNIVIR